MVPKQAQFALILMLVVVLTQLLGQAGTALVDWAWKEGHRVSVIDGVVEFLVAAACVATAFGIGHAWPRPSRRVAWLRALVAAAAVISSNTFLNTAGNLVGQLVGESALGWLLVLIMLAGVWGWAALVCMPRVQKWFQAQVDRCPTDDAVYPPGHVVLVMLVSAIDDDSIHVASGVVCERRLAFESLENDILVLEDVGWRWQQLMRGIKPAVTRGGAGDRTTIVLVGSVGDEGSFRQLETCATFLRRYRELRDERRVSIQSSVQFLREKAVEAGLRPKADDFEDGGIDFEKFNSVRQHVFHVVHVAADTVGDDHVFVDVTGGQKTASIAAAVATTGTTGFCQYVQTNRPHHVKFYDLHPPEVPTI